MRLPKEFVENLNWYEGAIVGFEQLGDKMIITSSRHKYTVEQMLDGMTKKNRHKSLWPTDKSRGKEIW